jgi:hypothetical protein
MRLLFTFLSLFVCSFIFSQQGVAINADGSAPHGSAMLDVKSTTGGLLAPRMTSAQRIAIASPATGLIVYQTDGAAGLYMNNGTPASPVWAYVFTSGSGGLSGSGTATQVAFWNGASSLSSNSNLYWDNTNNRLGIGTTTPYYPLEITGNSLRIGNFENTSNNGTNFAVHGSANVAGTGNRIGLKGEGQYGDAANFGVWGTGTGGTTAYGIFGKATGGTTNWAGYFSSGNVHVQNKLGIGTLNPAYTLDVTDNLTRTGNFKNTGTSGTNYGVYGSATVTGVGNRVGLRGIGQNGDAANYGLWGNASGGTTAYGLYATAAGATNNWAGYFALGKVYIADDLIINQSGALINLQTSGVDKGFVQLSGDNLRLGTFSSNTAGKFIVRTGGGDRVTVKSSGDILQVAGDALISNGGSLFLAKTSGLRTVEIKPTESGVDGASMQLYNSSGVVTIEMDADYGDGDGRIITSELEIKGGSDLAENFDITGVDEWEARPGMLVSIDTKNEGKLCITTQANDKALVGVISGANGIKPGMLMGQQGSIAFGKYPVALAGRVYVLANAEGGEINAGDFITSSSQKGYAKKASLVSDNHGAIIGKAMGKPDPKTGFILVLINLQ